MQGAAILDGIRTIGIALLGSFAVACLPLALLAVLSNVAHSGIVDGRPAAIRRRRLAAARQLMLMLLIPAAASSIWPGMVLIPLFNSLPQGLQHLMGWLHGTGAGLPLRLVLGTLPAMLLPVLQGLSRMPDGQARAGAGLGAGSATMLRLIWLPQLGPVLALGLLLAAAVDVAALAVRS